MCSIVRSRGRSGRALAFCGVAVWIVLGQAALGQTQGDGHRAVLHTAPAWLPDAYHYDVPFFPQAEYDPAVAAPAAILGYEVGERMAAHAEIERCFQAWADAGRLALHDYGRTHEGRRLYYASITSQANRARLDAIRESIGRLADPRKLSDEAEAERLIRETPAVAWLAYSIHGDETSGADAALAVAYRLIASNDAETRALLDELVILIDPLQNPDGRERFIRQAEEFSGVTPTLDMATLAHSGRWPSGRTNHYLFDLNRDWVFGTQPETRGRWGEVAAWNPQLFVDSHEMWHDSTFMTNPAREPFNPHLAPQVRKWWETFADDSGRAFDAYGWSYYTREWADFWYPGYSDAWACYHGAIGMLYEQAGIGGRPIRERTGTILTYREAVHHQAVATWANLSTLRANRTAVLADYVALKRAALADPPPGTGRSFLLPPGGNETRRRALLDILRGQGVEVSVATEGFVAETLINTMRTRAERREFPAGTAIVQRRQPRAALVGVLLDFDPRMSDEFLNSERRELEMKRRSRIYDVTGWSPPLAFGLDAWWAEREVTAAARPYAPGEAPAGAVAQDEAPYAYVLDAEDDGALRALAFLHQAGVQVRVANEPFMANGRRFERGSLLIRRHENGPDLTLRLRQAAAAGGVSFAAAATARSPDESPDLGGGEFTLLEAPRVAMFAGESVSDNALGEIWHLFDHEIGQAISLVAPDGWIDLRRYNVLILAPGDGYDDNLEAIKTWVSAGGTLVAVGSAAEWLADEEHGLSGVRRRADVIEQLEEYADAVALERSAGTRPLDFDTIWDDPPETLPTREALDEPDTYLSAGALDEYRRIFSPRGTILRGVIDPTHWLAYGVASAAHDGEVALFKRGSGVLMSGHPVATPVRFAARDRLRLSGLLWPEAAARLADSAYATVERHGHGQVILLADRPNFRGAWPSTRRLLVNAVLLGPGCGASRPAP